MPFDWGYVVAGIVVLWIAASIYKKRTGRPISELYMGKKEQIKNFEKPDYRRVYINRGMKQ